MDCCGVARHGKARQGVVWHGIDGFIFGVWSGGVRRGWPWNGWARNAKDGFGMGSTQSFLERSGGAMRGPVRHGLVRHRMDWRGGARFGLASFFQGEDRHGLVPSGVAMQGGAWFGMGSGIIFYGPVRFGQEWRRKAGFGAARQCSVWDLRA